MIEYLYFVKFENDKPFDNPFDWEEDVFETFDEAKEFANSMISSHPEIHQTEIVRNDFGECIDSNDLGMIWSWKNEMSDIPEDNELTFSKEETFGDTDFDNEFSDDDIVFETDCVTDKPNLNYFGESLTAGDEVFCKVNKKSGIVKSVKGDTVTVEFTGGEDPDRIDTYYKTDLLPALRTMVEAMEEIEDEVECVWCNELFPKEQCRHDEKHGWLCDECDDELVECSWCEELYPRSECRHEVNLGWLCPSCVGAIKSRGERMTFSEELAEAHNSAETVELEYDKLTIELQSPKRDVDDWDEVEYTDSYTYEVSTDDVATAIWENFLTEEDVADVKGGFDTLEDDTAWEKFLDTHFDSLFEKYYNELLAYFKDDAKEAFENEMSWEEYQDRRSSWNESVNSKSMLEELEEAEDYSKRLTMCPECGETSYDVETGFCISCGFNN